MAHKHLSQQPRLSLLLVGAGLVGSFLASFLARWPRLGRLRILDRECFAFNNRSSQILPCDIGRPKAAVLADQVRQINPALEVEWIHADLVAVPWGIFRCDVVLACLDSKGARRLVNEAAWRYGVPWIDAGVAKPLLARVGVFVPGDASSCYECGLDDADYAADVSHPCQPAEPAPATDTSAHHGALAAALQATQLEKLTGDLAGGSLAGRELLLDALSHQMQESRICRRASCRFDHQIYQIRQLDRGPRGMTLADAFSSGRKLARRGSEVALQVPGRLFERRLVCRCGASRVVCRLKGRLPASASLCRKCGGAMTPVGFEMCDRLVRAELPLALLARPMAALAFRPLDVFTLSQGKAAAHFELGTD